MLVELADQDTHLPLPEQVWHMRAVAVVAVNLELVDLLQVVEALVVLEPLLLLVEPQGLTEAQIQAAVVAVAAAPTLALLAETAVPALSLFDMPSRNFTPPAAPFPDI
jgi:hypothetical protein